ncbi:hypothetical protein PFICI_09645 [Pestalotiopsis fici W106-1]|uniref:Uncharacterized protein n=1 Tax=Pestalotiopsis fici (strain W106-1 / CGMCC3.15140) TaxID=1229662 RepID=W3X330_PESFW|nr:uncharacterized protein PFICI_09645 [Pestalotiopsis fici W106-1]ETS79792.1 hypothetical protein PFICI_09645 [Pestalotiopsis fici W106-1]
MFQIDMRTTSATAKARGEQDQASVCSPGDDASRITYISTKQFHLHGRRRKLPRVMLAVLCILFCSSAGGIALAVVLILDPVEVRGACLSRDFILYAALLSLLYIALHIRAALRDHVGTQKGPPQYMYGDYLHASALIVARLSIVAWICALVATAAMIANASPLPLGGLASKSPILNLLICIGALYVESALNLTLDDVNMRNH